MCFTKTSNKKGLLECNGKTESTEPSSVVFSARNENTNYIFQVS